MKKIIFAGLVAAFSVYTSFGFGAALASRAHAESGEDGGVQIQGQVNAGVQVGSENASSEENHVNAEAKSRQDENSRVENASGTEGQNNENENENEVEVEHGDENIHSTSSLEASIETRQQELDAEEASSTGGEQESLKDNSGMRLAVHALLSSRDLLGGIGPEVSALAQNLNGSVTSTINLETRIQNRGFLTRLLWGGDHEAGADLLTQVQKNQAAIDRLTQVIANCASCSADLKVMLQNQLTVAQDAQTHLTALAQDAQKSQGIIGSILALFGK